MTRLRAGLLTFVAATVLLAACAPAAPPPAPTSPPAPKPTTAPPAATSAPAAKPAAAPAAPTTAPAAKPAPKSAYTYPQFAADPPIFTIVSETAATRLVRDARGEVTVPKEPKRIVTLDDLALDIVLGVGLKPIAAVGDPQGELGRFFDGRVEGVEVLPGYEPNLEAVLALRPDLIVSAFGGRVSPELYQNLSKIAPTLTSYTGAFPFWRQATLDLAAVLGAPERGKQLLAEYDAAVAAAREKLPSGLRDGSESLAVLQVQAKATRIYGPGFVRDGKLYPTNVSQVPYGDLRLTPPPMVRDLSKLDAGGGYLEISPELLPRIEADHVLLFVFDAESGAELERSPLFRSMPAVKQGRVYRLPRDSVAFGPVNMRTRLDEFVRAVNGG